MFRRTHRHTHSQAEHTPHSIKYSRRYNSSFLWFYEAFAKLKMNEWDKNCHYFAATKFLLVISNYFSSSVFDRKLIFPGNHIILHIRTRSFSLVSPMAFNYWQMHSHSFFFLLHREMKRKRNDLCYIHFLLFFICSIQRQKRQDFKGFGHLRTSSGGFKTTFIRFSAPFLVLIQLHGKIFYCQLY